MKKQILLIIPIIFGPKCFSQISFENGYYIDNSNQKVECLIKNNDWESNPTKFDYKHTDTTKQKTLTIESVKEFGIYNRSKYVRYTVNIDRSSDRLDKIDNNINPIFQQEILFLKVLIEGRANLYFYNDNGLIRFFYCNDSSEVEQLIYKIYLTSNNHISENNLFRQQLLDNLKCQDISVPDVQNLKYDRKNLVNLFETYNNCHNSESINFDEKQKRDLFNLTIRPGMNYSSLYLKNYFLHRYEFDYKNELGFRLGIEVELIMPFNNNKLALFFEPTYQYFNSAATTVANVTIDQEITAKVDYKSIELPVGMRYYLFLNDRSKLYINPSFVYDFEFASSLDIIRDDGLQLYDLDIKTSTNFGVGLGYKYCNRYSIEIKYQFKRNIMAYYFFWKSTYNTFSIILGYSLF